MEYARFSLLVLVFVAVFQIRQTESRVIAESNGSPPKQPYFPEERLKRQVEGFEWNLNQGNNFQNNNQQNRPTTTPAGSTTTTMSPALTNCLSRCLTTTQYNPVCGSDGVTYPNRQRLECASRCGIDVVLVRGGTCAPL